MRVKRGYKARRRRKKVLKLAKGFRGGHSKLFRTATDAVDKADNEFGEEKLLSVIQEYKNLSSKEIINNILHAVNEHSRNVEQFDDITIVVIKRV